MTIEALISKIGQISPWLLLSVFFTPPVLAWGIGLLHRQEYGDHPPWNYIYAALVYLVCIPGMFSCTLTAYSLFFIRQNLLRVNFVVYFLPIICMIITLVFVRKNTDWDRLPGVDRLYALMVMIGVSFAVALAIQKTRIWIFFGGTVGTLILIALVCFALLKWASYMLFRSKDRPRISRSPYGRHPAKRKPKARNAEEELEKLKKRMKIDW